MWRRWVNKTYEYVGVKDGTTRQVEVECHPDPLINRVLNQICRADLEQTIHRLRLVRRTVDNPARIILGTNVPLNLHADEVITWDELMQRADPVGMLLARGVVPTDWDGRAKVLADFFGTAKVPASAARQWFEKRPTATERLDAAVDGVWAKYEYKLVNARYKRKVLVHPRHLNPNQVVSQWLGQIDVFEARTTMSD